MKEFMEIAHDLGIMPEEGEGELKDGEGRNGGKGEGKENTLVKVS